MPSSEIISSFHWMREYLGTVRPAVQHAFDQYHRDAALIPDPALRTIALQSLTTKQFHCEGGGVFTTRSQDPQGKLFAFLLPFQILADYLDSLTDRGSTNQLEPIRRLHQSLWDAVTPSAPIRNYYQYYPEQEDGGYIAALVGQSQTALQQMAGYETVQPTIQKFVAMYTDLQVYKHGPTEQRVPLLKQLFTDHHGADYGLYWWEFAAACGSTLQIFSLLNALNQGASDKQMHALTQAYFPWIAALHILLDYWVDQEEDIQGGDLNFVSYYPNAAQAIDRMRWIYHQCLQYSADLPDAAFHRYIARGLLGFYLSDRKVRRHIQRSSWPLLREGGSISWGVWLAAHKGRMP
ncbi:MAG: DUF2600 family protein [Firmicutes bacterium]|nr:DUF2600 family protein [Bacillota bacterium]